MEATFVPSMSSTPSPPGTNLTSSANIPTSTGHSGFGKNGGPSSMTVLFGSLVIFSALFAAFLLLCFFWQYRRAQRRRVVLEYDETISVYRGVPDMWEVWTQGEPSGSRREWGSLKVSRTTSLHHFCELLTRPTFLQPLSANVEYPPRVNPEHMTSPASNLRRCACRRPKPPTEVAPPGDLEAAKSVPMGRLRMTFIIAMPSDPPNRRQSVRSQGPYRNGDVHREYAIGIYHAPFREESSV